MAITKIENRGIGESGNRGIGEYGNGKRYRYAVCGIITNYQIQVYSQKNQGNPPWDLATILSQKFSF